MTLTPYHIDVLNGKICPYCKSSTKVLSEADVYGKTYRGRSVIACVNFPKCDSYVGTHDDGAPLGRLANKALRIAKRNAHEHFDKLWREKLIDRDSAYENLSDHLKIDIEFTHIGMFNINTCKKVSDWSKIQYSQLK